MELIEPHQFVKVRFSIKKYFELAYHPVGLVDTEKTNIDIFDIS